MSLSLSDHTEHSRLMNFSSGARRILYRYFKSKPTQIFSVITTTDAIGDTTVPVDSFLFPLCSKPWHKSRKISISARRNVVNTAALTPSSCRGAETWGQLVK